MVRTFVMGDIHGNYKGLYQCLVRSGFNYDEDTLIQLGDICDGWSEVYKATEELLGIKNLIAIRGNHDQWFREWLQGMDHGSQWEQGADATYASYLRYISKLKNLEREDIPSSHKNFYLNTQVNYYIDKENRLFVHGGFNRHMDFFAQPGYIYFWDRDLWSSALSFASMVKDDDTDRYKFRNQNDFKEIFIGHTATTSWGKDTPMKAANVWNLDTGSGYKGKLTIMDVDTKEFWQSDEVSAMYPEERGRSRKK